MNACEEKVIDLLETMGEEDHFRLYQKDSLYESIKYVLEQDVSAACEEIEVDLSELAALDKETLDEMSRIGRTMEKETLSELDAVLKKYAQQIAVSQMIYRAQKYRKESERVLHTANQWMTCPANAGREEISNRVYEMSCFLKEHREYNWETKQQETVGWSAAFYIFVRSPYDSRQLACQESREDIDKAEAVKFLEEWKKAYAYLFKEISPPVPEEYADLFQVKGTLLPGYRIEGQDTTAQKEEQAVKAQEQKMERSRKHRGR